MNKKRLFFNTVADDFNPSTDIAAAPWCFVGMEHIITDWHHQKFYGPFSDPAVRIKQSEATKWLAHQLIQELAPDLNSRHGTNYSIEFWNRLLINWIIHLVQGTWKLHNLVEHLVNIHGDKELEVQLIDATSISTLEDTNQFVINFFKFGPLTWGILSGIIQELAPPNWTCIEVKTENQLLAVPQSFDKPRPHFHTVPGIRRRRDAPFVVLMSALTWLKRPIHKTDCIQSAKKPTDPFPASFLRVVDKYIKLTMPRTLTDNFVAIDDSIRIRPRRPGAIRLGAVNLNSDFEAIESAHSLLAGEKVISVQHGGAYGWADCFDHIAEVEYSLSGIVTWGWRKHNELQGNFIPLPCPMLSRHKHRQRTDSLMMVGTGLHEFTPRLDQYPPSLEYRADKKSFLDSVNKKIREHTVYRQHPTVHDFTDASFLQDAFSEIKIHSGDAWKDMLSCQLLVLDHPSTPLCQALAWNVPTVAFWDHKKWSHNAEGHEMFNHLKTAKILFESPIDAATHINEVWGSVDRWWRSGQVQSARRLWVNRFARTSRFWWLHWFKAVYKI